MKPERRFLTGAEVSVAGNGRLEGYAALFFALSDDLGGFREEIRPGAFARAVREGDVRALFNHDPSIVLGRTKAGTLRLAEDSKGLHYEVDLPPTQAARDLRESVRRGDVTGSSFGFRAIKDAWLDGGSKRALIDVDLFDVSPVTFPAYAQASVTARSLPWEADGVRNGTYRVTRSGLYTPAPRRVQDDVSAEFDRLDNIADQLSGRKYFSPFYGPSARI